MPVKAFPQHADIPCVELTAEQLLEIVQDLRGDPAQRRRNLPRVGLRHSVTIWPCDAKRHTSKDAVQLRLRDISRRGLGAVATNALDVGNPVLLDLPREETGERMWVLGRVVRSQQQQDKSYLVGIELMLDTPRPLLDVYINRVAQHAA